MFIIRPITVEVKGRIKPFPKIYNSEFEQVRRLIAVLYDKWSSIELVAFGDDCDVVLEKLQVRIFILKSF